GFAAERLHAKTATRGVAAVSGRSACFLVCHRTKSFVSNSVTRFLAGIISIHVSGRLRLRRQPESVDTVLRPPRSCATAYSFSLAFGFAADLALEAGFFAAAFGFAAALAVASVASPSGLAAFGAGLPLAFLV